MIKWLGSIRSRQIHQRVQARRELYFQRYYVPRHGM